MFENLEELKKKKIIHKERLSGGFSFETWKVVLEDGENLIFRTAPRIEIEDGKVFDPYEIFNREKLFYSEVNTHHPGRCPIVYEIVENKDSDIQSYQVMSYIEGVSLEKYIKTLEDSECARLLKDVGIITAEINNIKPDESSSLNLGSWRSVFHNMLLERLNPLVNLNLLDEGERDLLLHVYRNQKIENDKSLLHLDMRLPNLIYKNGSIHVIDSEHCRIGDPLYELAIVDVAGLLTKDFIEGYTSTIIYDLDKDSILYKLYKLERLGALSFLFNQIAKNESMFKKIYNVFISIKDEILNQ